MKQIRSWIPVLGILALLTLFLKLPEVPNVFGFFKCTICLSNSPYLLFSGVGYFALLVAVSLLFPSFPSSLIARGGLVWAILLALTLTYIALPNWCIACLIGHVFNILIWTIWVFAPPEKNKLSISLPGQGVCLLLFVPISVVALFSCLNLTFMAYGFKNHSLSSTGLKIGDAVPSFPAHISDDLFPSNAPSMKTTVFNFISPNCLYCKQQLPILNAVATQAAHDSYQFINISPELSDEFTQYAPTAKWVEDKDEMLRKSFKVSGYPTLFIVNSNGKITQIIPGVPKQLKASLLESLGQLKEK